jgi:hypothetical protein
MLPGVVSVNSKTTCNKGYSMFLVKDPDMHNLIFFVEDPRKDGYWGEVEAGVSLEYDMEKVHSWPDGTRRPDPCVGVDPDNPKNYKVFKFEEDRRQAGYRPVPGTPLVFGSWSEYARLRDLLTVVPSTPVGSGKVSHQTRAKDGNVSYLHYEFDAGPNDVLEVALKGTANVLLLDESNFRKYQAGERYQYVDGGLTSKEVTHLHPPTQGHWHVVIDLGGYLGAVRAAVRQIPEPQTVG